MMKVAAVAAAYILRVGISEQSDPRCNEPCQQHIEQERQPARAICEDQTVATPMELRFQY
jgi:hypothetical protein